MRVARRPLRAVLAGRVPALPVGSDCGASPPRGARQARGGARAMEAAAPARRAGSAARARPSVLDRVGEEISSVVVPVRCGGAAARPAAARRREAKKGVEALSWRAGFDALATRPAHVSGFRSGADGGYGGSGDRVLPPDRSSSPTSGSGLCQGAETRGDAAALADARGNDGCWPRRCSPAALWGAPARHGLRAHPPIRARVVCTREVCRLAP